MDQDRFPWSKLLVYVREQMQTGKFKSVYMDLHQRWMSMVDSSGCWITIYANGEFVLKGTDQQVQHAKAWLTLLHSKKA